MPEVCMHACVCVSVCVVVGGGLKCTAWQKVPLSPLYLWYSGEPHSVL